MKITQKIITVAELMKGYKDNGEEGAVGFDGKLTIRPAYERKLVYDDEQRKAIVEVILQGFPVKVMHCLKTSEDTCNLVIGQQYINAISQYVNEEFTVSINGNEKLYHDLAEAERKQIDEHKLMLYICEGTPDETYKWFCTVNK